VQWYRSGNTFSYKLSEPGSYHVRAFARTPADIRSGGKNSASLLVEPPPPPQITSVKADRSGTVSTGRLFAGPARLKAPVL